MSRAAQLLYIDEGDAAHHLEIARRLLDPYSRGLPHITLRHSRRPVASGRPVEVVDLGVSIDAPATFDAEDRADVRTLVLICHAPDVEHLVYKPDFPNSLFHITLYDGEASELAGQALARARRRSWGLELRATWKVHSSSSAAAAAAQLKPSADGVWMTPGATKSLRETFGLVPDELVHMGDDDRLGLLDRVFDGIHAALPHLDRPKEKQGHHLEQFGQLAFWSQEELGRAPVRDVRRALRSRSHHATPPELARAVTAAALAHVPNEVRFLEPAIGSGIFYATVRSLVKEDRLTRALGIDIDPETAGRTSFRWRSANLEVVADSFLDLVPAPVWNLLVSNPPYRRSQSIANDLSELRGRLLDSLGLSVSARSDLYVYFVLASHEWLEEGGIAAWILPTEFLTTNYGKVLREYLATKVQLLRIHTFDGERSEFDGVLTTTCMVLYRRQPPSPTQHTLVSVGGQIERPDVSLQLPPQQLAREARWNFEYLTLADGGASAALGDFFTPRRGIATGANDLFVFDETTLRQIEADPFWTSEVVRRPSQNDRRWVIDTDESLNEIRARSPKFAAYLEAISEAANRSVLVRRRKPWYKQETRQRTRLYFLTMAKRDTPLRQRFFLAESDESIALNNLIGLYPNARIQSELDSGDTTWEAVLEKVRAVNEDGMRRRGRTYGNGLLKFEPGDLAQIPLGWDFSDGALPG